MVSGFQKEFTPSQGTKRYGHGGCFDAEVLVTLANGELRPIAMLEVGDRVLSRDSDGILAEAEVVARGRCRARTLVLNEDVLLSTSQPVMLATGSWRIAHRLLFGDSIRTESGEPASVRSLEPVFGAMEVWWIEVAPHHVFFANGLEVHNKLILRDPGST